MDTSLEKLQKVLQGHKDSRSLRGRITRGNNVYRGASLAAHRGGGIQFGRPSKAAIKRRLGKGV